MKPLTLMCLCAASFVFAMQPASAQKKYPERPVRIILPFGAGGVGDVMTRIVADKLSQTLGQRFVVENNPGAGGIIAARRVLQSPADGYTLAYLANATALSVALFEKLPFDPIKDFEPVSSMGYFDLIFVTAANSPYKTLDDFIKAAKERPSQLNVGTIVAGSMQNLGVELLKSTLDLNFVIVPFRNSGEVLIALERNDVQMAAEFYAALRGGIEANKFIPIGTSGVRRTQYLPSAPTMKEAGAGDFEVTGWSGIFAPAGTPSEVIKTLNASMKNILSDPEVKKKALELGIEAGGSTPEDLHNRFRTDIGKWSKVIEKAGIKKQ